MQKKASIYLTIITDCLFVLFILKGIKESILFAAIVLGYGILRTVLNNKKLLVLPAFLVLFVSLQLGYLNPMFNRIEFFFVPLMMLEFSLCCSWPFAIPVILSVSVTSPFFFSIFKSTVKTELGEFPFYYFGMMVYLSIAAGLIFLSFFVTNREKIEKEIIVKDSHNKRLMAINSEINSRLFRIQQDSSEEERMRITKEVHDTAGYVFINVIMMLQAALAIIDKDYKRGKEKVEAALEYVRRGMNEIRMVLREMRAYEKPSIGLQNELHDTITVFMKATDLKVSFEYGNWPNQFKEKETEMFVSSLVQECLTNTIKHGNASKVDITCWQDSKSYSMFIQDNGGGNPKTLVLGIGLSGIEDFIHSHNGTVDYGFNSTGFFVKTQLPLNS